MYKIWFERGAPADYRCLFADIAEDADPGEHAPHDPYHRIEEAHGVLAGGRTYNAAAMDRAPRLLVISRTGIGYDTVDVDAASERGIAVVNAPDAPTIPTAETAIALMMNVARRIKRIENLLRRSHDSGEKLSAWEVYDGIELSGKRLALVGLGRIGGHVARVAKALGMELTAYDPYITDQRAQALGVERALSLDEMLGAADVVSLHIPLSPNTRNLMNAERFAQMKQGAIFLNVSRGGLVDENALAAALDSGHLFGAGLDVTHIEPPLPDNPLLNRDNVLITPHIGGSSVLSRQRLFHDAIAQITQVLRGQRPPNLINPDVWDTVRSRWEMTRND